ncbi:MTH1187 family thiamine-binding protein [Thermogutta sp.]|uniref:MTH1187 family thiamine-binding protein n=1 Tax=Thermogutta sp. TaxID=1962930 RepID=UPI00321F8466
MVLLEFSIYPLDKGESLSAYVARCVEIVHTSGLKYQCHAMGTIIEGEYDQVMDVVRKCFEALQKDCNRIECIMKLDYRKGYQDRISGKVRSIEEKLGHPVQK